MSDREFTLKFATFTVSLLGLRRDGLTVVSASCTGNNSAVSVEGLALAEEVFSCWHSLRHLYDKLEGTAHLWTVDSEFSMYFESDRLGHISLTVQLSNDPLAEEHKYKFDIDQSYLPGAIRIMQAYLDSPPKLYGDDEDPTDEPRIIIAR